MQGADEDAAQLRAQLQAAREAAAAAPDAAQLRTLEQQLQELSQRNAELEAAAAAQVNDAKSGEADERLAELEAAHSGVLAENARLQVCHPSADLVRAPACLSLQSWGDPAKRKCQRLHANATMLQHLAEHISSLRRGF